MNAPFAFPVIIPTDTCWHHEGGMTLRDYFAGQALPALIGNIPFNEAVKESYAYADQMIYHREQVETPPAMSDHVPFPTSEEAKRILDKEGIDTTELKQWASGKLAEIKERHCQHDFELTWSLDPCEYTCRKCGRKEQA